MSDRAAYVYVDLDGEPVLVGTLYARFRKNRESATFTYDPSWLSHPSRFALEPALVLHDLSQHTHTGQAMFGAFGDSAPDRWGRMLSLAVDEHDQTASLELAFQVAVYFGIDDKTALLIANEIGQAVASWRNEAQRLGIQGTEIDRMASAFEHTDLRQATHRS